MGLLESLIVRQTIDDGRRGGGHLFRWLRGLESDLDWVLRAALARE
jgi:hypothetical protein